MEDRLADLHELVWFTNGKYEGNINLHALKTYKGAVERLQIAGIPILSDHLEFIKRYEGMIK
jgi:hypothetical protein